MPALRLDGDRCKGSVVKGQHCPRNREDECGTRSVECGIKTKDSALRIPHSIKSGTLQRSLGLEPFCDGQKRRRNEIV